MTKQALVLDNAGKIIIFRGEAKYLYFKIQSQRHKGSQCPRTADEAIRDVKITNEITIKQVHHWPILTRHWRPTKLETAALFPTVSVLFIVYSVQKVQPGA